MRCQNCGKDVFGADDFGTAHNEQGLAYQVCSRCNEPTYVAKLHYRISVLEKKLDDLKTGLMRTHGKKKFSKKN